MEFIINLERTQMKIRAACVITSEQLHCLPPTTAAYAERIEGYLKAFGIPASVSRTTGEISVTEGKLTVTHGTDQTRYEWEHVRLAADLKSEPLRIQPNSLLAKALEAEDESDKVFGDSIEPVRFTEARKQWGGMCPVKIEDKAE